MENEHRLSLHKHTLRKLNSRKGLQDDQTDIGKMSDYAEDKASQANILYSYRRLGKNIFVKSPQAKCTTSWPVRTVAVISNRPDVVEVDGTPQHVCRIRICNEEAATNKEI
ncbi:hypothetical protein GJ496_003800 [Pomphorhynchus laevis]|nr:hypothetical protein GJ496_003800 [Pomphorhynchus laevis]